MEIISAHMHEPRPLRPVDASLSEEVSLLVNV